MGDIYRDMNTVYDWANQDPETIRTLQRYGADIDSLNILTNTDWQTARKRVANIADRIRGKSVIELGSGVGYTAIELARLADKVIAIENDPAWNWIFCTHIYKLKPDNLIWIFGDARQCHFLYPRGEVILAPQAAVCVIFTRSGMEQMESIGKDLAHEVIMYHQEFPDDGEENGKARI